jgi:hypothetical protein
MQIAIDEINAKGGVNGRMLTMKTSMTSAILRKQLLLPKRSPVIHHRRRAGHICSSTRWLRDRSMTKLV